MHFDIYAGESLVEQGRIRDSIEQLKAKKLLATKTSQESRPDWDKRREEMKEGGTKEAEPAPAPAAGADEDANEGNEAGLALAVDLTKWKMGKPVVQKAGSLDHP